MLGSGETLKTRRFPGSGSLSVSPGTFDPTDPKCFAFNHADSTSGIVFVKPVPQSGRSARSVAKGRNYVLIPAKQRANQTDSQVRDAFPVEVFAVETAGPAFVLSGFRTIRRRFIRRG